MNRFSICDFEFSIERPTARAAISRRASGPCQARIKNQKSKMPSGTVLAAVLVVAALAATVAVSVLYLMRAEVGAQTARSRGERAYGAALSGLEFSMALLAARSAEPPLWDDNPEFFHNRLAQDDGSDQWYFTVYADSPLSEDQVRFGLSDESARLNLNTADEETLRRFAPLPPELVDALLDWRDADDEPRREGAEQTDTYDRLPLPYRVRNGPLRTLEEVFLIKGFNASVVYGEDANLNGLLDPNEDDSNVTFPLDDRDGALNRGLYGLATVWSYEPNVDRQGDRRLDLNGDASALEDLGLSEGVLAFIKIYRAEGNTFKHPSDLVEMEYQLKQAHPEFPDLKAGDTVAVQLEPGDLAVLLDRLTVGSARRVAGLVNVNAARPEVLAALPAMDEALARQIADVRTGLDAETRSTIAWLYTQGVLDAPAFKALAPKLTARSFQYRVRSIGFGAGCGQFRVLEAVVDVAGARPQVLYARDLTRLGLPLALNAEELQGRR